MQRFLLPPPPSAQTKGVRRREVHGFLPDGELSLMGGHWNPNMVPQEPHVLCSKRGYRNPTMVPQEPSALCNKTDISLMQGHRNPNMVPQEPSVLCNKTCNFQMQGHRNPKMVPQEPSVLNDSSANPMTFGGHPVRLL